MALLICLYGLPVLLSLPYGAKCWSVAYLCCDSRLHLLVLGFLQGHLSLCFDIYMYCFCVTYSLTIIWFGKRGWIALLVVFWFYACSFVCLYSSVSG